MKSANTPNPYLHHNSMRTEVYFYTKHKKKSL